MLRCTLRVLLATFLSLVFSGATVAKQRTSAEVVAESKATEWRTPQADNLMLLELDHGQVLFELAPEFAPSHIANLRKLVMDQYFDGLAIIRSQDNYVVQWGDPAQEAEQKRSLGDAAESLAPEFFRPAKGLAINFIESRDAYDDKVGFVRGFPVGTDGLLSWLTHCYGMLGAGRGMAADSGNAAQLYVVTGHSPRHLDRNVTLLGRALSGMQHLSSLPRGTGPLGFYTDPEEHVPIKSIRVGKDIPEELRNVQIMRTDSESFAEFVRARTFRTEEWFLDPAGKIGLCNISVPMREPPEEG
ncbi:MAG: peptidylprolyl isomerase [Gammaproteobacteria bacterium]|nr:peptidylprolyl isomerase [Gammaproteobacteria bacterium]